MLTADKLINPQSMRLMLDGSLWRDTVETSLDRDLYDAVLRSARAGMVDGTYVNVLAIRHGESDSSGVVLSVTNRSGDAPEFMLHRFVAVSDGYAFYSGLYFSKIETAVGIFMAVK